MRAKARDWERRTYLAFHTERALLDAGSLDMNLPNKS